MATLIGIFYLVFFLFRGEINVPNRSIEEVVTSSVCGAFAHLIPACFVDSCLPTLRLDYMLKHWSVLNTEGSKQTIPYYHGMVNHGNTYRY